MSQDLLTQLAEYGTYCEERQGSVLADEVIGNVAAVPEPTPTHSTQPRRRWLVAVGAAALILILVGGVAWLARSGGTVEPATPTTTVAPPETTLPVIPAPPPESLNRSQMEHQVEFLEPFRERAFLSDPLGCQGPAGGPFECTVNIDSPTLGGPVTKTFTVLGEAGQEPDEPVTPDDMQEGSLRGAAVRDVAEEGLAALYVWALETYPDETAARCRVGFAGDGTDLAWSPGYAANFTCGEHLAGLLTEFSPSEAFSLSEALETPDPTAGLWSRVEPATPDGAPAFSGLFDVADTPVGLLATGHDGLWISQDAVEWRPYARDSVDFEGEGEFSKIAASDLGIVVMKPAFQHRGFAWFSSDGEEWTVIEGLRPTGAVLRSGNALAASDERFLIINEQKRVMSSTDGTEWQTVEGLPESDFRLIEVTPLGFYASSLTASAGPFSVWTSPDGVEWSQLSAEVVGGMLDLAGSQNDLVAVTIDSRILHSPDGAAWTEVQTLQPVTGSGDLQCMRVGASEIGFLVVATLRDLSGGEGSGVPAAWFSESGRVWSRVSTGPVGDSPDRDYLCQAEVIPYNGGFLSVTDNQADIVWLYER